MTSNAINYVKAQEERRANRERERHNKRELAETRRSNKAKEALTKEQVEATKYAADQRQKSTLPGLIYGGLQDAGKAIKKGWEQLKSGNLLWPLEEK